MGHYLDGHPDHGLTKLSRHSKWMRSTSPFSIEIIRSTAKSVGDAMRNLDEKQLIKGDFICVYGDVVANIPLEAALAAHRARREKRKNAIMTMILREAGDQHRTQSSHMRPCFVIDPAHDRCVHYEQVRPRETARLDIPEDVFKEHVEVEIRQDLIDCGIDICTPEVLAQWSDNFDWQAARRGFLYGILKDFETNNLTIHTHILNDKYCARVRNLKTYDAISKDIVSRWAYPICPDSNLLNDQSYQLTKGLVYKEDGVVLARSSVIGRKTVLGRATSIGEGSTVTNSTIGRRCVIGRNVQINGAYIWDDARIGDNTIIEKAIVANEASIGKGCRIKKGALISYGVVISNGVTVRENMRITRVKCKRDYDEDTVVRGDTDPKIVGEHGEGFELVLDEEEEDVAEAVLVDTQSKDLYQDDESCSDPESDDEEDMDYDFRRDNSRSGSFASIGEEDSADRKRDAADFHHEAAGSIFDSLQKQDDPDTIQLELTALTLASNAEGKQVRRAVAVAMSKHISSLIESGNSAKTAVNSTIPKNQRLITGCVGIGRQDEQAEFLLFLQTDLLHRHQGDKVLLFASNALATEDLVEAEGFEQWWNDPRSSATEALDAIRADTKQLVDVLVGDEDEDGDEDDESDEDEE